MRFNLDDICQQVTTAGMRRVLSSLHLHHDSALGASLARIKLKGNECQTLAFKTLALILHAARPLTVDEILDALAVELWLNDQGPDYRVPLETMLETCLGLVVVQRSDMTVRFSHYSVQEYLITQSDLIPSEIYLAKVCLTYLLFDELITPGYTLEQRKSIYPFLSYAAQNWTTHVKGVGECDPEIQERMDELFQSQEIFTTMVRARQPAQQSTETATVLVLSTPLHIAAGAGLLTTTERFLEGDPCIGAPDIHGRTALHEASRKGRSCVVRRLLQQPLDIDVQDVDGMTALQHAAEGCHKDVIGILLDNNAKVTGRDNFGRTALSIALANREDESSRHIFERLLSTGGPNVVHTRYGAVNHTLLHQMANLGYEGGVRTLLAMGADPHAEDNWGYAPVHLAARKGHTRVVEILLEATNNQVRPSYCHHTPLQLAAKHGREDTVDVLLSTNATDINVRDFIGFTPLHSASAAGQVRIVKRLLSVAEIAIPGETHVPSPFQLASWGGHSDILKSIYQHYFGKQIQQIDADYNTDALWEIEHVTQGFSPRVKFPYRLNAICYLSEHYGLMHLKAGKFALASAWYDIALVSHPVNSGVVDPAKVINPIKICDHCGVEPIVGPCFTCKHCTGPCYDLCSACFNKRAEIHKHANYIQIPASSSNPLSSLEEHLDSLRDAIKREWIGTEHY
jgi:ankyrin repeat protein